jgi:hypothetical protein
MTPAAAPTATLKIPVFTGDAGLVPPFLEIPRRRAHALATLEFS